MGINKWWYIHAIRCHSATKEGDLHTITGRNPKPVLLGEKS